VSGNSLVYLLSHPRLAARRVGERLGFGDRVTNLAEEADKLGRALQDVNNELEALGAGSPTGRPFVFLDYPAAQIRISARAPKRRDATTKEPFTVAWLERELQAGDVLYDLGANIGAYALIAACGTPGVRVVAFEPGAETFAVLCENIVLNGVERQITPVPIVLGSETRLGVFRYVDLRSGRRPAMTTCTSSLCSSFVSTISCASSRFRLRRSSSSTSMAPRRLFWQAPGQRFWLAASAR
jgi:FkbM family methyltransferase